MSSLEYQEKRKLEALLQMKTGYVLNHSDRTFEDLIGDLTGLDIHGQAYLSKGTSKANKLRSFWEIESDSSVGKVLQQLVVEAKELDSSIDPKLLEDCQGIVNRLMTGMPNLEPLTEIAVQFDSKHLKQELGRMAAAVEN